MRRATKTPIERNVSNTATFNCPAVVQERTLAIVWHTTREHWCQRARQKNSVGGHHRKCQIRMQQSNSESRQNYCMTQLQTKKQSKTDMILNSSTSVKAKTSWYIIAQINPSWVTENWINLFTQWLNKWKRKSSLAVLHHLQLCEAR